ncbi:hypothetical protein EI555_019636 [Monodon monoceros]|uniref:Uncharacterized protein n=1 Tax=Monodon monoceros TaxID=40151 RepID=A0A4U1FG86_MONMO|nr:hypothetical protein EI555_019636 [Monodon monoceros]
MALWATIPQILNYICQYLGVGRQTQQPGWVTASPTLTACAGLRLQWSVGVTGVVVMLVVVFFPKHWKSIGFPASAPWCLCSYCTPWMR